MAYLGEIRMFAGLKLPDGWLPCDGSLLPISANEALFQLIGTTYGGDGVTTFGLPDLRGRLGIHMGQGPGLSARVLGETGGATDVTLQAGNLPAHTHALQASTGTPVTANSGVLAGALTYGPYNAATMVNLSPATVELTPPTATASHTNEQPTLRLQYIIALYGIFPSPAQ